MEVSYVRNFKTLKPEGRSSADRLEIGLYSTVQSPDVIIEQCDSKVQMRPAASGCPMTVHWLFPAHLRAFRFQEDNITGRLPSKDKTLMDEGPFSHIYPSNDGRVTHIVYM